MQSVPDIEYTRYRFLETSISKSPFVYIVPDIEYRIHTISKVITRYRMSFSDVDIQLPPRSGEPWRGARTADNVAARSPGPLPVPAEGGGGGGCVGAIAWTRVVRFQSAAITNWGLNYKRS